MAHVKESIINVDGALVGRYEFDGSSVRVSVPQRDGRTTFYYQLFIAKTNARVRQCLRWDLLTSVTAPFTNEVRLSSEQEGPFFFVKV
jgi:uncharacterized protein YfaP (DUF2135 family)